ncbi:hypothetical protein CCP3SC15_330006 [Gammaproteobacteria bacterium]
MTVEMLSALIALLVALGGGLWIFAQVILRQLDSRFEAQEAARKESAQHWERHFESITGSNNELRKEITRLELDFTQFQARVAKDYVSRETWVEHVGAVNIKLDRICERVNDLRNLRS